MYKEVISTKWSLQCTTVHVWDGKRLNDEAYKLNDDANRLNDAHRLNDAFRLNDDE